jgi:hypothetical protein
MNRLQRRRVLSAVMATFAVTGLVSVTAVPAFAEPTPTASATPPDDGPGPDPAGESDFHRFVLDVRGTTIPAGAAGKVAQLSIHNLGESNTWDVSPVFDLSELDTERVGFELIDGECDKVDATRINCGTIGKRDTIDTAFRLVRKPGAGSGPAGRITIKVYDGHYVDEPAATATADVAIGGNGGDLFVWAPDQPRKADGTVGRMKRGQDGDLWIVAGNQGDKTVHGVKVTTKLVKGATFPAESEDCTVSEDRRTSTCTYPNLSLIPLDTDTDDNDDNWSTVMLEPVVHIAKDAQSPKGWGDLPYNTVTVEALATVQGRRATALKPTVLPDGVHGVARAALDVDSSDNRDDFTIMLDGFLPEDEDGAGGTDGGQGGGLPVTGANVGLLGGVGSAVIGAGVLLMVAVRRRRIVPVVPRD